MQNYANKMQTMLNTQTNICKTIRKNTQNTQRIRRFPVSPVFVQEYAEHWQAKNTRNMQNRRIKNQIPRIRTPHFADGGPSRGKQCHGEASRAAEA